MEGESKVLIDTKTSKAFRGIAILMVIASHYAGWMYTESFNESLRVWISTWGVYGVDIFFLLSGYGLVKSYQKSGIDKGFVIKRVMNSYVPYILIAGFLAVLDKHIDSAGAFIKLLIGYDYWFMCVLFAFYIMFMLSYRFGGRAKEILLTLGVIGFSYWLYIKPEFQDFWFLSNGAFLLGVYGATLEDKLGDKLKSAIIKSNLAFISFAVMVICAFWHVFGGALIAHLCASIMFTLMTMGLCVQLKGEGFVLPTLGTYSLYVYLVHTRLFWKFVAYKESWSYFKGAVIAGLLTLVFAVVLGFCLDFCLGKATKFLIGKKA